MACLQVQQSEPKRSTIGEEDEQTIQVSLSHPTGFFRDLSLGCIVLFKDKNRRVPGAWWQRTWLEPSGIELSCAEIVNTTQKLKFHKSVMWIHEWYRIREMVDYRNIKKVKTQPLVMDVCKRCCDTEMLRMTNGLLIWHLLKCGKNSSETRDCLLFYSELAMFLLVKKFPLW